MMAERRALARLARRSISTAPLRSVLLIVLVALLVAGGTTAGLLGRSIEPVLDDYLASRLGSGNAMVVFDARPALGDELNARVGMRIDEIEFETDAEIEPADQFARGGIAEVEAWQRSFERNGGIESLRTSLGVPTGLARVGNLEPQTRTVYAGGPFGFEDWYDSSTFSHRRVIVGFDASEPLTQGIAELTHGRFPEAANEVAVSERTAERWGYELGQAIIVGGESFLLVGLTIEPFWQGEDQWLVTASGFDDLALSPWTLQYRVFFHAEPGDVERVLNDAQTIVGHRIGGAYRDKQLDRNELGGFVVADTDLRLRGDTSARVVVQLGPSLMTLVFGTLLVLVGAVMFAMSIRRRSHELGQLVATGADGRHLRRVLRYEAGWLGLIGAVLGIAIALGISFAVVNAGWLNTDSWTTSHVRIQARDLFGPAVVGFLSLLVAARWAANKLDDWSLASAASGELPVSPPVAMRARWGLFCFVGAALVPLGVKTLHDALRDRLEEFVNDLLILLVAFAFILAFVGVLILANAALAAIAQRADRLPLLFRLVVRSTGRERGRSAVVVGILTFVVFIPIMVGASFDADDALDADEPLSTFVAEVARNVAENGSERMAVTEQTAHGSGSQYSAAFADRLFSIRVTGGGILADPDGKDIGPALVEVQSGLFAAAADRFGPVGSADLLQVNSDVFWQPVPNNFGRAGVGSVYVATPRIIELFELDADTVAHLDGGALIDLSGQNWLVEGEMVLWSRSGGSVSPIEIVEGPLVFADRPVFLVGVQRLDELQMQSVPIGSVFVTEQQTASQDRDAFVADADRVWVDHHGVYEPDVYSKSVGLFFEAEAGGGRDWSVVLLVAITLLIAAVISLLITSLSAIEFDREASLMIAVGALPSFRRRFLGMQTLYQFAVGVLIGIPLALITYNGARAVDDAVPTQIVIPWATMGLIGIAMPLCVAGLVGLVFRDGEPAVSRRVA